MIDKALEEKQVDIQVGYFLHKMKTSNLEVLSEDIEELLKFHCSEREVFCFTCNPVIFPLDWK